MNWPPVVWRKCITVPHTAASAPCKECAEKKSFWQTMSRTVTSSSCFAESSSAMLAESSRVDAAFLAAKVSLDGGAPFTLCSAPGNRGGSWGLDDAIIFTPSSASGLFRVSAAGGTPKPLTIPDRKKAELSHRWPEILPGGKAVLFTIWTGASFDDARIGVLALEASDRRVLVHGGTYARYAPTGHLVYARAGGLGLQKSQGVSTRWLGKPGRSIWRCINTQVW
jgi:hypothetical protein